MPKAQQIILTAVGLIALTTAILGYTGIWSKMTRDPYYQLKQEAYTAIDKAQLWYMRPKAAGGGGRSFMKLDFKQLGFEVESEANYWNGNHGSIRLEMRRAYHFDMIIRANDGAVFSARDLSYDTRPVFSRE